MSDGKNEVGIRAGVPAPVRRAGFAVELVWAGRTAKELAREFECSASTICNWVRQVERDEGRREDGLRSSDLEELRRLRREVRQLREEREILAKATAGSLGRPARYGRSLRAREGEPGPSSGGHDVPGAGRLPQRVLRVARSWTFVPCSARRGVERDDSAHPQRFRWHVWDAAGAPTTREAATRVATSRLIAICATTSPSR